MQSYSREFRRSIAENRVPIPPATILLVDDTEAQRYAVSRMLRAAGHTVLEAGTGAEARRRVVQDRPDVVVLDVNLPDESGFDICRDLKRDPATSTLPVLQISASFVGVQDRVHGLEGGADAYLTPPLDSTEVLATVNALLRMKRAEERAREIAAEAEHARAELSAVLASMAEGLAQLSTEGKITYINAAGARMLSVSAEGMQGRYFHELVHGDETCEEGCRLKESWGTEIVTGETVFRHGSMGPLIVEYTSAPLVEEGVVTGTVISFRDITEKRRAEDALRVTEKLASTGRMAATIAHEINNPLEAVTNLLYLIAHHPSLDESVRKYTAMAEQELARVTHITRQTLGFYRRSEFPTAVDVIEVLENVLAIYGRRVESGDVKIVRKYRFHESIQAFAGEIRQVFSNLIINAIEAVGHKGVIFIDVNGWWDWGGDGELRGVRVTIADNGPGIRADRRPHIFEPFFTTKGEKGTGLGLWVTHGIVRKHGGKIRMRSRPESGNRGTCFTVYLPFRFEYRDEHSNLYRSESPRTAA